MQPNKSIDDLEYLANIGFEKIAFEEADLRDLHKKIRLRSHSYNSGFGFAMICFFVGMILGITVFFSVYDQPFNFSVSSGSSSKLQEKELKSEDLKSTILDTIIVLQENFVQRTVNIKSEKTENVLENSKELFSVSNLIPQKISSLPSDKIEERKIKFIVNSPVFYIHDLKVTNYGTLYFKRNKFISSSGLSANFSNHDEQIQLKRPLKTEPDYFLHEELATALLYFKNGKFSQTILVLDVVDTYNDEDLNCDFYRGMSYFHLRNFEKALQFLEICISSNNNVFLQEASFYRAQCLLALDRKEEAKLLLQEIINEGEFYAKAAQIVLGEF